ncbi:MAG: BadF/BadG/BcrA/BcrD ATPase family protein [Fuerstiella sp.]
MTEPLVIGVDAGGTKTSAWIAPLRSEADNIPLGRGQGGPGNPQALGFKNAFQEIECAIREAMAAADDSICRVERLCICAAGAGRAPDQIRIREWAEQKGFAQQVRVATDAEAVLAAASPESVGVILICGTGSLAWGRNAAGETYRAGGWGYLIGDEGSAWAIAMAGLRAAARAADRRGPQSTLLAELTTALQLDDASGLIEYVYGESNSRARLAGLAGHVFACAAGNDPVATEIVDRAAQELAVMIDTVATRLQLPSETALGLTGGVIINQHDFRRRVLRFLQHRIQHVHLVTEPVSGAVTLARTS